MMKLFLALVALAVAVHGKSRVQKLPANVWYRHRLPLIEDESRIVGGSEVTPNSIPFQVSLQYPSFDFHFCGGAILNANYIITAGHCCDGQDPTDLRVNAGEHCLSQNDGTEEASLVESIHIHESYNPNTVYNDICLLKLASPLSLNSAVAGASLPQQGQDFTGTARVSGWGTLSAGGSTPDCLMAVDVPIVSDAVCRDAYGQSDIADSMICAGEAGKDSCQGDSGGPMTCGGVHCGIVSWGYSCAAPGYPGVYTETSYFVDWLNMNS